MISVETVLEERFPGLTTRQPLLGKTLIYFLRNIFHEREFKQFEKNYPHVEGFDFVEQVLDYFDFTFRIKDNQRERIPSHGRVVIVANHPIGSLDGLALLKLVGEIRPDVKAVANEILYALQPLRSLLLPVDNMGRRSGKEQLRAIRQHLDNEGAIIIFPAGEVSRIGPTGIRDGRWNNGFLHFADSAHAPILPMFIDGRNSMFFYSLSLMAKPISTLWLIREMFKQASNYVDISVGQAVYPEQYQALAVGPKGVVKLFKRQVYNLNKKQKHQATFSAANEAIAHPENRQLLRQEIRSGELLGHTQDNKAIYLYRYQCNSVVMREVGRLRELSFRAVKEGTGKRRDIDPYDRYYDHLILWDDNELEIAGAYRMVRSAYALAEGTQDPKLYTQTLFDFEPTFKPYLEHGLELGRSFVQPRYWGKRSIDYLWHGIGAYLNKYSEIRYLFGPVSISHHYPDDTKELLVRFYRQYFGCNQNLARAKKPFDVALLHSPRGVDTMAPVLGGYDQREDFRRLKCALVARGLTVPTLYKQYTELCEDKGAIFLAFNIDNEFSDCVDGLIVVDLDKVKPEKKMRYMGNNTVTRVAV